MLAELCLLCTIRGGGAATPLRTCSYSTLVDAACGLAEQHQQRSEQELRRRRRPESHLRYRLCRTVQLQGTAVRTDRSAYGFR